MFGVGCSAFLSRPRFIGLLDTRELCVTPWPPVARLWAASLPLGTRSGIVRAVLDLFIHQEDEDGEEQRVDEGEHDQRGEHGLGADHAREPHRRAQQAVDDPRLAADFRGPPAELIASCGPSTLKTSSCSSQRWRKKRFFQMSHMLKLASPIIAMPMPTMA